MNGDESMLALQPGDRGATVLALQKALVQVGHPVAADGDFGPKTQAACRGYAQDGTRSGVSPWLMLAIYAEAAIAPTLALRRRKGIKTVGAWCGSASLANPKRDVQFAADHNINRLDIVVNDHSRWRAPQDFTLRPTATIKRLCELATAKGIEVHLMSWVMPHRAYIDRAAEVLVPLCADVGASSLMWDAEEPWTLAKRRMPYAAAASHLGAAFEGLSCPMGVTGIGYASVAKLGPLAEVCDYVVPQAYSTRSSGLDPETAPGKFHKRWAKAFGRPVVLGLAAYRQTGIPGHTAASAMKAAARDAAKYSDTIIYWNLSALRKSPSTAQVVAQIRRVDS